MAKKRYYKNMPNTVEGIIDEKIKVLRELCIVDTRNEESIRNMLLTAIRNRPQSDPLVVLDSVAKRLIAEKL